MPLQIVRNDITKMKCDAIVNAANSSLLGGGGVDGAIHKAAGAELLLECKKLGGCKVGQAKLTKAYKLPAKYIIHTVGPIWQGGSEGEASLLRSCYIESLNLAVKKKCKSIAFPLISTGVYGYPKAEALQIAIKVISDFLLKNDILVYIVVFDKSAFQISEKLFSDITEYIDDFYAKTHIDLDFERIRVSQCSQPLGANPNKEHDVKSEQATACKDVFDEDYEEPTFPKAKVYSQKKSRISDTASLSEYLNIIDESFSQMLLRKIDEKGIKDSECYKKANVDRKLFSKIRKDVNYRPSKCTAIAFAISLEETKEFLMKAGYALSHSNKFDIIIEYFILHKNYNIFEINEALFAFDQSLLGA